MTMLMADGWNLCGAEAAALSFCGHARKVLYPLTA